MGTISITNFKDGNNIQLLFLQKFDRHYQILFYSIINFKTMILQLSILVSPHIASLFYIIRVKCAVKVKVTVLCKLTGKMFNVFQINITLLSYFYVL